MSIILGIWVTIIFCTILEGFSVSEKDSIIKYGLDEEDGHRRYKEYLENKSGVE